MDTQDLNVLKLFRFMLKIVNNYLEGKTQEIS